MMMAITCKQKKQLPRNRQQQYGSEIRVTNVLGVGITGFEEERMKLQLKMDKRRTEKRGKLVAASQTPIKQKRKNGSGET